MNVIHIAYIISVVGNRYILDNPDTVKNRRILDVGCGCGAVAIAAAKMQAKYVVANDIDPYAVVVTKINGEINECSFYVNTQNLIESTCEEFDTILIGDMFYNEEFAEILFKWLHRLAAEGKQVLIGDPGRHGLTARRKEHMTLLAKYDLSPESCLENRGFTDTALWTLNK